MQITKENKKVSVLLILLFLSTIPTTGLAETTAATARDWLTESQKMFDTGHYSDAIQLLQGALEARPDDATLHRQLAIALIHEQQHEAAIQHLMTARQLAPADLDTLWLLAHEYETVGSAEQAIEQYQAIIDGPSATAEDIRLAHHRQRYLVATRYARHGNFSQAREMFAELSRADPDDQLSRYSLGVAEMFSGMPDAAIATFSAILDKDPGYANAYINLARIANMRGQTGEAVDYLQQAIDNSRDGSQEQISARIELSLIEASLLASEGNRPAALEIYLDILEKQPNEQRALTAAATIAYQGNDHPLAMDLYSRLLSLNPGNQSARLALAQLLFAAGDIASAYEHLQQLQESGASAASAGEAAALMQRIQRTEEGARILARAREEKIRQLTEELASSPDDRQKLHDLAQLYLQQRQWREALPLLERLQALEPFDDWVHIALSGVYDQLGRFRETVEQYAWMIMLERRPEQAGKYVGYLRLALGKALYTEKRLPEATAIFSHVIEQDPGNILAHFYLGLIYTQEESMLKAIQNYQQIIAIMPSHAGARLNLAAAYDRLNREEDALTEYRKLLAASPDDDIKKLTRQRIREIEQRIRGMSGSLSYTTTYDGNSNQSKDAAREDLRSDLALALEYRYKSKNGLRWRLNFNPSYANFHYSQLDFINMNASLTANLTYQGTTYLGGLSRRTSRGLITSRRSSASYSLFGEALRRMSLPLFLALKSQQKAPSNLQLDLSYTDFQSTSSPFFDARTLSLSGRIGQPVGDRMMAHLSYNFVRNNNTQLIGSDYAYHSHGLTLRLEKGYLQGGVVNVQYGFLYFNYLNPDSFSRFTRERRNTRHSLSLGTSYAFGNRLTLSANATWERNESNLPVGFIINTEDIIEGQQSSSLSDYERGTISVGLSLSF